MRTLMLKNLNDLDFTGDATLGLAGRTDLTLEDILQVVEQGERGEDEVGSFTHTDHSIGLMADSLADWYVLNCHFEDELKVINGK